jgi:cbb3-type cytochrome oxidase subunit 3
MYTKTRNFLQQSFIIVMMILLLSFEVSAQGIDFLRSTGKIYSVVAVIVIIFAGIIYFLYRIDNKLTKLENHIKNEQ